MTNKINFTCYLYLVVCSSFTATASQKQGSVNLQPKTDSSSDSLLIATLTTEILIFMTF